MAVTKGQTRKMNQEILARALAPKAAKVSHPEYISRPELDVIKAMAKETARKAMEIAQERADRERSIRLAQASQKAKDKPNAYGYVPVMHYKNP